MLLMYIILLLALLATPRHHFVRVKFLKVVAKINLVHFLNSSVMEGISSPGLLPRGVQSPNNLALKTTSAYLLSQANVMGWQADRTFSPNVGCVVKFALKLNRAGNSLPIIR